VRRILTLGLVLTALFGCAAAADAAGPTFFAGAVNGRHSRPLTLYLSADGTLEVVQVNWPRWGGSTADGVGVAEYHGCTPDCAAGRPHHEVVDVRLSDPVSCRGVRYYNTVRLFSRRSGAPLLEQGLRLEKWAPCRA
jgi:hypothetical protein